LDDLDEELLGGYVNEMLTTHQTPIGTAVEKYLDTIDGAVVGVKCTY